MSLMSMTGFGSATFEVDGQAYRIDVKTVNHKNLNVRAKLPQEFGNCEGTVRRLAKKVLKRGAVDILLTRDGTSARALEIVVDRPGLTAMWRVLTDIAQEVGAAPPSLDSALKQGNFLEVHRKDASPELLAAALEPALSEALAAVRVMREREAVDLVADMRARLSRLEGYLTEVERVAPEVYSGFHARLEKRLADAAERHGLELDQGRLAAELVIWSDKSDVTEEVVRARTHIGHVRELLASGADESGKRLDFLAQELFREFNTIGSKCRDAGMAAQVVDSKVELEKIREQVQNLA